MPSNDNKHERNEIKRRRLRLGRRAALTQEEQRRAEANRELQRQLNSWTPRRIIAWVLMVLAFIVAGQHLLAHLAWRPIPVSMGWQDILIGYPMAGLLLIVGVMVLDPIPRKP